MNKKQLTDSLAVGLIFVFLIFVCVESSAQEIDDALLEANASFTYKGKPIHPGLVAEFSGWISDDWKPKIISVDIAAASDTNEYYNSDVELKPNGYVFIQKEGESEYFYYKWLGKLKNGLHILDVGEGGGGSGVFMDLFIVKFEKGYGFTPEGQKYERLLMSIVRNEALGDRDDGKITVLPDRVILGKSQHRDKPVVLEFDNLTK